VAAAVGGLVGGLSGSTDLVQSRLRPSPQPQEYPLPHHIPKYPGGISLRFAMVHDVLHERFPRHGRAYYVERNRRVRAALQKARTHTFQPTDEYFKLQDDLGVGLDSLGEFAEAVGVMRDKLRQQQHAGQSGRRLYTTYANLGTFLIHASYPQARTGDKAANARLREGLSFIRQASDADPEANFGREAWQAAAVEFALVAIDRPGLLLEYDLCGNRLQQAIDPAETRCVDSLLWTHDDRHREAAAYLAGAQSVRLNPDHLRVSITKVGAEPGWRSAVHSSIQEPVPFDEPTLGMVGMWRLGGGANPQYALALGEIMLRVGQRYIAWCAYERAAQMKERFWPDHAIQEKFAEHCRARQAVIEDELAPEARARLRPAFAEELELGQKFREGYQRYEAEQIAAGASIEDPRFYDAFYAGHASIASPVGAEDRFVVIGKEHYAWRFPYPTVLLGAGICAFATAWVLRARKRL
jgi:hypothetical protein